MPITSAYLVPHPPIILPEVGRGEEVKIAETDAAYNYIAKSIAAQAPHTIVIVSPHARAFRDYIELAGGGTISGDMRRFNAPDVKISVPIDTEFTQAIEEAADEQHLPVGVIDSDKNYGLDHGSLIPLYYVNKYYGDYKIVLAGISGLSPRVHADFGRIIASVAGNFPKNTVLIASGDLSHRLLAEGPYGYHPDGPLFDSRVVKIISEKDFGAFLNLDEKFCDNAAECGLKPLQVLAGAVDGAVSDTRVLSHEGPFGVGYCVAEIKLKNKI